MRQRGEMLRYNKVAQDKTAPISCTKIRAVVHSYLRVCSTLKYTYTPTYQTEADLQKLIADNLHPLLRDSGDTTQEFYLFQQVHPLRDTENGAFAYFLDHLFIDQDDMPVLVEVKRSSDTCIRREVAGQMLDYATYIFMGCR